MGAANTAFAQVTTEDLVNEAAILYAADPTKWDYIFSEAKNKAMSNIQNKKIEAMSFSNEISDAINRVRRAPAFFVLDLEAHLETFIDDFVYHYKMGNQSLNIRTVGGKAAVSEAIEFLSSCEPVEPLEINFVLENSSMELANDLWTSGRVGHEGISGSTLADRVEKFGVWNGTLGENIDYGKTSALGIVLSLIVDDGVPSKVNRMNILKPEFKYVGAALVQHKIHSHVCVIDFASNIKDRKNVIQEDTLIEPLGYGTDGLYKVLESIPIDTLMRDVETAFDEGLEVGVDYSYINKSATIIFQNKQSIRRMKWSWG